MQRSACICPSCDGAFLAARDRAQKEALQAQHDQIAQLRSEIERLGRADAALRYSRLLLDSYRPDGSRYDADVALGWQLITDALPA